MRSINPEGNIAVVLLIALFLQTCGVDIPVGKHPITHTDPNSPVLSMPPVRQELQVYSEATITTHSGFSSPATGGPRRAHETVHVAAQQL